MDYPELSFEPAVSMIVSQNKDERISRLHLTSNLDRLDNTLRKPSLNQALAFFGAEESSTSQENVPWKVKALYLSIYVSTAVVNTVTVPLMNYFSNREIPREVFLFWKFVLMVPVLIPCMPLEQKFFNLESNSFLNRRSIMFILTTSTTYLIWQFFSLTYDTDTEGGLPCFLENIPVLTLFVYYLYRKFTLTCKESIGIASGVLGALVGSLYTTGGGFFSVLFAETISYRPRSNQLPRLYSN